jgi:hypothetical protein
MSGIKIPEMYYFKLLQADGSFYYQKELELRKTEIKCYIWSTAVYGAELKLGRFRQ